MYEVKNRIFLSLTKTQKSAICNNIRALVKKMQGASVEDIFAKFVDDEKYYLEISASRFDFLSDLIDEATFLSELELYIKECKKYYDYKKAQEPLIQAQKEYDKKKRKFLQEVKMSKEQPTKKQIFYYNSLCKRHNLDKKDVKLLSKLDLKNMIDEIINEYSEDRKNT